MLKNYNTSCFRYGKGYKTKKGVVNRQLGDSLTQSRDDFERWMGVISIQSKWSQAKQHAFFVRAIL